MFTPQSARNLRLELPESVYIFETKNFQTDPVYNLLHIITFQQAFVNDVVGQIWASNIFQTFCFFLLKNKDFEKFSRRGEIVGWHVAKHLQSLRGKQWQKSIENVLDCLFSVVPIPLVNYDGSTGGGAGGGGYTDYNRGGGDFNRGDFGGGYSDRGGYGQNMSNAGMGGYASSAPGMGGAYGPPSGAVGGYGPAAATDYRSTDYGRPADFGGRTDYNRGGGNYFP